MHHGVSSKSMPDQGGVCTSAHVSAKRREITVTLRLKKDTDNTPAVEVMLKMRLRKSRRGVNILILVLSQKSR